MPTVSVALLGEQKITTTTKIAIENGCGRHKRHEQCSRHLVSFRLQCWVRLQFMQTWCSFSPCSIQSVLERNIHHTAVCILASSDPPIPEPYSGTVPKMISCFWLMHTTDAAIGRRSDKTEWLCRAQQAPAELGCVSAGRRRRCDTELSLPPEDRRRGLCCTERTRPSVHGPTKTERMCRARSSRPLNLAAYPEADVDGATGSYASLQRTDSAVSAARSGCSRRYTDRQKRNGCAEHAAAAR